MGKHLQHPPLWPPVWQRVIASILSLLVIMGLTWAAISIFLTLLVWAS